MLGKLRHIFSSLLFLLLAVTIAQATSITISSYQVTNWQYGGSTAKLRIYSDTSFITSDGKTIIAGNPNTTGGFYKEVIITISGTTATIPLFTIDSTNDGQNLTSARYTAVFFNSNNSRLGSFSPFTQFFVTTDGGTTQTWTSIASYNFTGAAPPDLRYTFDDATIQRLISSVSGALTNPMTTLGDTIYGASGGTPTRLPIGTAGQFYKVAGGIPSWATLGTSDIAELLAVTDLSTYTATSGTGTTALRTTITSPTTGQAITWNGTNWVNSTISAGAGVITSINADATPAQTLTVNTSQFPTLTITDNGTGDHKFGLSGAIGVAIGGTNLTSYTAGDLIYATGATTLAKRAIGTTGYPLIVSGGLPAWGQLDLTLGVTGVLPVANGGTNNAFFTVSGPAGTAKTYTFPNANATILTDQAVVTPIQGGTGLTTFTTGDLIYASASNTLAKRAIGTTNQSLMVIAGVPTWGTIDLSTSAITGVLPFANGGIGAAGLTPGYVKSTGSAYSSVAVPIPIADGGTNNTSFTSFAVTYYTGSAFGSSNAGTTGTVLTGVTSAAPQFSATPTLTSLTLSGLTQNSVVFAGASGLLSQNNTRLTWDNSNFRLGVQDTIRLLGSSSGFTGLKAAATAGGTTYTLPSADGTVNQVLSTDGAGTLFWATVSGGGSGITSLNGLTTSTQTITIATTGATSPTIDQPTSSQNRIIIPLASASNSSGLVSNASQVLSGAKTLDAVLTLANGTTSNPPLILTCSSCAVTTSPQAGAIETDGQFLYYTQSLPSTARKTLVYTTTAINDSQLSANVQLKTERNANNGYAGLNSSGFVDLAQGGLGIGLTIGAAGTFIRSDGSQNAYSTDGSALTALNASNISTGTLNNARLSGVELTANKAAAGGYASLDGSTKVPVAQISEVLAIADLTTYNGVSGSGTTAIASTITTPADGQYLAYNSGTNNWENRNLPASSVHTLLNNSTHSDTNAATVTRGALIVGSATPRWDKLVLGAANKSLTSDGTDAVWAFVDINAGTTGTLTATRGGTGLTSGTSGGLLYFNSTTTIASSGALTANALLYGQGAASAPGVITNNATATRKFVTQVSSGAPTYDVLANGDVTELLAVTDLTTYASVSGTGTAAIKATFTSLTTNDVLTWNGSNWINQAPGGGSSHDILSPTHSDSLAASVVRGDIIVGNATPKWARVAVDGSNSILINNGTDTAWGKVSLSTASHVTGILGASNGGTNNAFFQVTGPATTTKTYTLANSSTTIATILNKLSDFAATSSSELAGIINDETGSGVLVFSTSPSLTTPVLGVATATSINKVAITAPASGSTLTIADGSSLITSGANSLTLTTTGTTNVTLPSGTKTLVATDVAALSSLASVGTITTGVWNGTDIAVPDGGTGVSSATAYALLAGGTTSTGAFQSLASVGTAGKVLMSNGAGALPSFQTPSGSMQTLLAQTSNAEVTTSSAENTELTYTLAGNTLSTNRGFHVQVMVLFTDGIGTRTLTPRLKFGGTTIHGQSVTTSGTQTFLITIDWYLYNSNATNVQYSSMDLRYTATTLGTTATTPTVLYGQNTAAIDTTASKDIVVTMQMGTSNAAIKYKVINANVRLMY